MKKHSNASLVAITFINHKKKLEIKYADNGKGINPKTFDELNVTGVIVCPNENCKHTLFLQINY